MKKILVAFLVCVAVVTSAVLFISQKGKIDSDPQLAKSARTNAILSAVGITIDDWIRTHNSAPSEEEGISVLGLKKTPPVDGWGRSLIYKRRMGGESKDYLLYSVGLDGIDSNQGGDDISYRKR